MSVRLTPHPMPARIYRSSRAWPGTARREDRNANSITGSDGRPTPNQLFSEVGVTLAGSLALALIVATVATAFFQ